MNGCSDAELPTRAFLIRVLRAKHITVVEQDQGYWKIDAGSGEMKVLHLPEHPSKTMLQAFAHKYDIPIDHFYHPERAEKAASTKSKPPAEQSAPKEDP